MKSRYRIGFFCFFAGLCFLLAFGYRVSYNRTVEKEMEKLRTENTDSISAKGEAVKNTPSGKVQYYVCELHGYLVVYLKDRKTIYELTDIKVGDLPMEVQQEVSRGKWIVGTENLYAFLENYSS